MTKRHIKTEYKILGGTVAIVVMACMYALTLHVFVFNSGFAPMGTAGIAVMIQYLTGFSSGYTGLVLNIPLLIAAWFILNRKYVLYTGVFVVTENLFILLFAEIDMFQYVDPTDSYIMAALFSGLLRGAVAGLAIWLGGSSGGTDTLAAMVQKRVNNLNFDRVLLIINCLIILLSFFVYGKNLNPVFLAVISAFCYSKAIETVIKGAKHTIEFRVITSEPERLSHAVMRELGRGVTIVPVTGGFTGDQKSLLLCVVRLRELAEFRRIIKRFDNTFAYFGSIGDVFGKFNSKPKQAGNDYAEPSENKNTETGRIV